MRKYYPLLQPHDESLAQKEEVKERANSEQHQLHVKKEADGSTCPSCIKRNWQNKHKHDDSFLQFGLTRVADFSTPDSQCVLCCQTSGNSSMFPAQSQRHLHAKHVDSKEKPTAF
jgi:hypothetical protein